MEVAATRQSRRWDGLALSQALGFALFAACLWWVLREFKLVVSSHHILLSLGFQEQFGTKLFRQLVAFAGFAWLLHALLGAIAFLLARMTEVSCPNIAARRQWLVVGWFALLTGLVMAANTTWHPASLFAGETSLWRSDFAGLAPIQWMAIGLALTIFLLLLRVRNRLPQPRASALVATAIVVISAIVVTWPAPIREAGAKGTEAAPHVVIIGIDSLRSDLEIPRLGPANAPHIRAFLEQARHFTDATSPLARTYSSWVSILTGRHPVTTNARVNLMPRARVQEGQTLGDVLRDRGYRAIYATDEVRFANFDKSFGFDQLITPPVGAIDFVLGLTGDLPLVNLVAATPAGAWLFPSHYGNRAAYVTYRPQQFENRLRRELVNEGPTFLTIHLTLAHWPYTWAGKPLPGVWAGYRDYYKMAIAEVDRQFDAIMQMLGERGLLDNTIVVLLSDHGEALGGETDSMLRKSGTSREIWNSIWGHGTSVLSPNQYSVVLAMKAFGRVQLPGPELDYDWPVSLEDVRPTIEEFATGLSPTGVDGISLLPYMANPARAHTLATRIRFTETDFNTPGTAAGRYEASGLIDAAAVFYELDRESGWVQFREERLTDLFAQKQRAAFTSEYLLAAIPGAQGAGTRYLFSERNDPNPQQLTGPPDPRAQKEARRLWDALHGRFPGELAPGS